MRILNEADWLSLFLGSIVIPAGLELVKIIKKYWQQTNPTHKLLGSFGDNSKLCKIFVRDLILEKDSNVLAVEPRIGIGRVPHVINLYAEVEGKGIAYIYNVLGQAKKTKNIELIGLGKDMNGEWNANIILLGAQSQKHFDFYKLMKNVAYRMDANDIYDCNTNKVIEREKGYGYGLILKAENPFVTDKKGGNAFLIGGYGVLGTLAAAYYFKENYRRLGKEFNRDCFGVVVRAPVSAGEEAVERLHDLDIRFKQNYFPTNRKKELENKTIILSNKYKKNIKSSALNTTVRQKIDYEAVNSSSQVEVRVTKPKKD